jgi:fatty acid desaturase
VIPADEVTGEERTGLGSDGTSIPRERLVNSAGVRYRDFKRTLTPRYAVAWTHLLAGHLTLLAISAALVASVHWFPLWAAILAAIVGSMLYGYTFAYINLFLHEAAHYHLARSRKWNDRLANLFIGILYGQDIKEYRLIHFDHHRYLGTPQDTERSYFDALNLVFFLKLLTGMKALEVVLGRKRRLEQQAGTAGHPPARRFPIPVVLALVLHGAIIALATCTGNWLLAGAWVVGMGLVYPFFGAVRQILEHRDENARDDVDYRQVPHGALARMFGDGPVASTLGGAGFNRHLLHHWEPQVSYTRLKDLERFLLANRQYIATILPTVDRLV